MRLFTASMAPYPRRVTLYLNEKRIVLDRQEVDVHGMEHKSPAFLAKNPAGKIPVLELDNGDYLPESAAIIEYLEELYPAPPMIGRTAEERAQVRATDRVADEVFTVLSQILLHTSPVALLIHPGLVQKPDVGPALQPVLDRLLDQLEQRIGDGEFLAGRTPTIADCTLFALMEAVYPAFGYELPKRCRRLRAWYDRFQRRPSVTQ
ncbi:glutathione S-transferase family protein [Caulobacter soli]|uniref:glutathione S-transferase family protein n=1 Tax=Caulobacter soli TaxID=2708539 RepID=UPI0013EDEF7B|nr:glutathione S-transferase family protein [Caulobacter soli]